MKIERPSGDWLAAFDSRVAREIAARDWSSTPMGPRASWPTDLRAILTHRYLAEVTGHGLFAMSFMDGTNLAASSELHGFVREAVRRYGRN